MVISKYFWFIGAKRLGSGYTCTTTTTSLIWNMKYQKNFLWNQNFYNWCLENIFCQVKPSSQIKRLPSSNRLWQAYQQNTAIFDLSPCGVGCVKWRLKQNLLPSTNILYDRCVYVYYLSDLAMKCLYCSNVSEHILANYIFVNKMCDLWWNANKLN